jgi:4-hydroxy-tetrahydrodipicolinate reductase
MNAGLVGYGKMGKIIDQLADSQGVYITARFDIDNPLENDEKTRKELESVPVLIEFSTPETVLKNVRTGLAMGKSMIVGTTGWQQHQDEVRKWLKSSNTGLVHASNFSLGVNLFYEIVEYAGKIMASFSIYEPFMEELHHQFKKDAPSGTALVIKKIIQDPYKKEIPISCVRAGFIPGTHRVSFDSRVDTIKMEHIARSREGFAEGALMAAKWIVDKKGFYSFQDILKTILQQSISDR